MNKIKYSTFNKVAGSTLLMSLALSACNSGGDNTNGVSSSAASIQAMTSTSKTTNSITPVIVLSNNSGTVAGCNYFLHNPKGAADGQTPVKGASSIQPGQSVTWNYVDKDPYSSDTTETSVCGYNKGGHGLNGVGTDEGSVYLEHNTNNNTLIITTTGLPTSKATLTCMGANGQLTTQLMSNNVLVDYTCYLDGTPASQVSINFGGALNKGTPPSDPANTLVSQTDTTTFTTGSASEANCMTDNSTGLMWVRDLNTLPVIGRSSGSAPVTYYQNAVDSIALMNQGAGMCGHNDWRLPSINEISSMINYTAANPQAWLLSQGFANLASGDGDYWTSTSHVPNEEAPYSGYFWIPMMSGTGLGRTAFGVGKYASSSVPLSSYQTFWVWPVRSTDKVAIAPKKIIQTGDTVSVGLAWPQQRFTPDSSGNCMVDKLTGLIWVKDQTKIKTFGGNITVANFEQAAQTVERLNSNGGLCGFTDWRVPHVQELASLMNYTQADFTAWLTSQGFKINNAFTGSQIDNYYNGFWTSDPLASSPGISGKAWYMQNDGEFNTGLGIFTYYNVLPVRGSSVI